MPTQGETTERDLVTEVESLLNDVGFRGDFETVSRPLLRRLVEEVERQRGLSTPADEDVALRQWKAEALPLLTRYNNLAETFDGELNSSKVVNLERGVAALREQLAGYEQCVTCACGRPTWHRKEDDGLQ